MATARQIIESAFKWHNLRFEELNTNGGTTEELLNGAYELIKIKSNGRPLQDNLIDLGIRTLNEMLLNLKYSGTDLGFTPVTVKADPTSLPDWSLFSVKVMLAVALASSTGKVIDEAIAARAISASKMLKDRTDPTLISDGLEELRDMLSEWDAENINLGYVIPYSADVELAVPRWAEGALKDNLAIRLGPKNGMQNHPDLISRASKSYTDMINRAYDLQFMTVSYPSGMVKGSGNRCGSYGSRFYSNERQAAIYSESGESLTNEQGQLVNQD